MGRKRNTDGVKKGPGRKSRKQAPPEQFAKDTKSKKIQKPKGKISKSIKKHLSKGLKKGEKIKLLLDSDEEEYENLNDEVDDEMKVEDVEDDDDNADDEKEDEVANVSDEEEEEEERHVDFNEVEEDDDDGEEEEEEEDKDLLPVEKMSKKLARKQKEDKKLAAEEFRTNLVEGGEEAGEHGLMSTDTASLVAVKQRISEVLRVLASFKKLREEGRSRKEYLEQLKHDLCFAYGYNEFLLSKYLELFPSDIVEFLEAADQARPETIRTNSLKTRRKDLAKALIGRGVNVDPVSWSKVGLIVSDIKRSRDQRVTIGATTEYLAGHYMLQGASSFLPCMALAPVEGDMVLDMAAAPGGKSTYLAQLMKNTGCLVVNDANKDRLRAVYGNVKRMGVNRSIICNMDGRKMPKVIRGFDRVLLDAPCTGSGVVSKHPSVKVSKDLSDVHRCSHLQKQLLLAAIDCLNCKSSTGGYVVYSTCSVLVEENEAVVNYALQKRKVKVVESGLSFGTEGFANFKQQHFHPTMKLAKRFYPHAHNLDGFFVCKLKKVADMPKKKVVGSEVNKKIKSKEKKKNGVSKEGEKKEEGDEKEEEGDDEMEGDDDDMEGDDEDDNDDVDEDDDEKDYEENSDFENCEK